jgi:hypothetical protein
MNKRGRGITLRFARVVAATRNQDFDPSLYVDHINRIRKENNHDNLRSVTPKENNLNVTPFKIGRQIVQLDENLNIIEIHENAVAAARKLGGEYQNTNINECVYKNNKIEDGRCMSGNFIWRYLEKKEHYICKEGEHFQVLSGNFQGVVLNYDNYMISNYGTVINIKGYSKKVSKLGYPTVQLSKHNVDTTLTVHVLVALVFVFGRTEEKCYVNHLDEKKDNPKADNLQWVTLSENVKYSTYKYSKPVKKISLETKEILAVFDSHVDGAISCGMNETRGGEIGKVCCGISEHAFGFYWQDIKFEELSNYPELTINKRKEIYG